MRQIDVSTEVFSRIWALRGPGEENEDEILKRILGAGLPSLSPAVARTQSKTGSSTFGKRSNVLWRDDIVAALKKLGGEADLHEIYRTVSELRRDGGRSLPPSTDAVIRRELENNSSDSESFTAQRDLFRSVNGIGGGRWALR